MQKRRAIFGEPRLRFGLRRIDFRPAASAIEKRQVDRRAQRQQEIAEQAAQRAVAQAERAGNGERRAQIGLLDPDIRRRPGEPGFRREEIGPPSQQIGGHAGRWPATVIGNVRRPFRSHRHRPRRFGEQHCQRIVRFGPRDRDEAAPRSRLRQVRSGAAHVEIGGQSGFEAQGDDAQRSLLQLGRLVEQIELRPGTAQFDILTGDRRGDDPALIGEEIVALGIIRRRRANLGRQPSVDIGIEQTEQPRPRGDFAIIRQRHACIRRPVERGQAIRAFGAQQRPCGCQPVGGGIDIEIGFQTLADQPVEHRVAKAQPPFAVDPRGRQIGRIDRRRRQRGLDRHRIGGGTGGERQRREESDGRTYHAGAIVVSSSTSSISARSRSRSTLRGLPKRAMAR